MASKGLTVTKRRDFSDLSLNAILHPNKKDLLPLKDVDAIKQAVKILVLTNFGERPFEPFFGGNVTAQLFENTDPYTAQALKDSVNRVLKKEPRIFVNDVIINFQPDNNAIGIIIYFIIIGAEEIETLTLTLNRTR
jgi:phage baseplate assembly protein W